MKMTKNGAMTLLESLKKTEYDKYWISHSICVGNAAGKIADALGLDSEFATVLGYLHDIGKAYGEKKDHDINGYNALKSMGYDDEYANICMTHSYLNNDVYCTGGGVCEEIPFRTEFIKNHEYTIYEKIVNLCDLMCTTKVLTVDKRLIDIILRYGGFENTKYHATETYKLKKFFDDKLGYSVYDLFPEIKENL